MGVLLDLFFTFAYLDVISIGGAMAMIPEMERQVVIVHGWMSHEAFIHAVALGLFVPGPNMLHVFHIGNQIAGIPGALAAGLGMFGPTSLVLAGVAKLENRADPPKWVQQFHAICSPITIGLMAAAAWNLGQSLTGNIFYVFICFAAMLLTARHFLGPTWVVLLAAILGATHAYFAGV